MERFLWQSQPSHTHAEMYLQQQSSNSSSRYPLLLDLQPPTTAPWKHLRVSPRFTKWANISSVLRAAFPAFVLRVPFVCFPSRMVNVVDPCWQESLFEDLSCLFVKHLLGTTITASHNLFSLPPDGLKRGLSENKITDWESNIVTGLWRAQMVIWARLVS